MAIKKLEYGNNARASLQASISAVALTLSLYDNPSATLTDNLANVPDGSFAAFTLTLEDEIVLCFSRSGATVTVYEEDTHALGWLSAGQNGRGFSGTSAASHAADIQAENRIIKDFTEEVQNAVEDTYTQGEIDTLFGSRTWKSPAPRACSFALGDLTLANEQTVDGVALVAGDDILVADQSSGIENGIYTVVDGGSWTRRADFDTGEDVAGAAMRVTEGSANGDTTFYVSSEPAIVGTDALVFVAVVSLTKASTSEMEAATNDTKYVTPLKSLEGFRANTALKPVRVASTGNVVIASALENGDTIDGITLATGDLILLKDQTNAEENGIYVAPASGAASRATFFDADLEIRQQIVHVQEGTANAGGRVQNTNTSAITVDTTEQTYALLGDVFITSTTRAGGAASGTEVIPHGLKGVPTKISVEAKTRVIDSTHQYELTSSGFSDGSVNHCCYVSKDNNNGEVNSGRALNFQNGGTGTGQHATISVDATNVTINWTLRSGGMPNQIGVVLKADL